MEQAEPDGHLTVTVELNTSLARVPIAILRLASVIIGEERALRAATAIGLRLTRWRVAGQRRWQWLSPGVCRG